MFNHPARPRPYWHVDLKWIFGILLFIVLNVWLLLSSLVAITTEKIAVDAMSIGLASTYSLEKGLDDDSDLKKVKQLIKLSPDGTFKPIPGMPITLKAKDLDALSPRELRLNIFRQIAEPIYRGETVNFLNSQDKTQKKSALEELGLLALVTAESHEKLKGLRPILALVAIGLLLPLIYFSRHFGRLASPGLVLMAASLPGTAVFNFLNLVLRTKGAPAPPGLSSSMGEAAGYVAASTLPPIIDALAQIYLSYFIFGTVLLILALLGKIGWKIFARKKLIILNN